MNKPEQLDDLPEILGWRIRPSWVGDSGTVYYALQQRRWWGWVTWHNKYLRHEAVQALAQCGRDWPSE